MLVDRAKTFGDRVSIGQGAREFTYRDLLSNSARIASELLGGTIDLDERRVALLCPDGIEFAISQWGIWRAGGVCIPLSSSATQSELEYLLLDSSPQYVLTQQKYSGRLQPICDRLGVVLVMLEDAVKSELVDLPEVDSKRNAMILYTSGTTNRPKGVVTTHRNIEAQIQSLVSAWDWCQEDHIPLFLPLHHIHGIINVLSCALWCGARIDALGSFELPMILSRIADKTYSLFMAVPTIYVRLIQEIEMAETNVRTEWIEGFSAMRLMVSGSAALPASVHLHWTNLTGQVLLERYGMTEIGMAISNPLAGERRPGSVGIALPSVDVRLKSESGIVIDSENVPGEIQVRGPSVFQEYWNQSEATLESFDVEWFRTGDMAVLEKGYYRIMGRLSVDIIKSGGYKLSALEIEDILLQHPQILQCAVVGMPDETWGEMVATAVVIRNGETMDVAALRNWCRDRLSPYKIPKVVKSVDELPRNAMGKVLKNAVKSLFL